MMMMMMMMMMVMMDDDDDGDDDDFDCRTVATQGHAALSAPDIQRREPQSGLRAPPPAF